MEIFDIPESRGANRISQCGCNPCNTTSQCGCGQVNNTPQCGCTS